MRDLAKAVDDFFKNKIDDNTILMLASRAKSFFESDYSVLFGSVEQGLKNQILEDTYINGKNKSKSAEMLLGELNGLSLFLKVLDDFIVRADEIVKKQKESEQEEHSLYSAVPYGELPDMAEASTMVG